MKNARDSRKRTSETDSISKNGVDKVYHKEQDMLQRMAGNSPEFLQSREAIESREASVLQLNLPKERGSKKCKSIRIPERKRPWQVDYVTPALGCIPETPAFDRKLNSS